MKIRVLFFGELTDFCGTSSVELSGIRDTKELQEYLNKQFSELRSASYVTSINNKIVNGNINLKDGDEVALLPPFSGG